MALPEHEDRNAKIDENGDPADDGVHIACTLKCLNGLRTSFRAADGSKSHQEPQLEIDVAQSAMLPGRDDRFPDNVRQVRSHCVIPIHSHQAQRRTGNETSAHPKKAAQDSNEKTDNRQIERVDV